MVYILYLVAETECMRSTEFSVEKSIGINSRSTEFSVENKKGITRYRKLLKNWRSIELLVEIKGL